MNSVPLNDLTWDDVLTRDNLIGGDFEIQYSNKTFRGPIELIESRGGYIWITTAWTAVMEEGAPTWRFYKVKGSVNEFFVQPRDAHPAETQEGYITFKIPYIGMVTIFPAGENNLDLRQVLELSNPA